MVPINITSAAPRATFTSVNIPNNPFVTINPVAGATNQTIFALQPNQFILSAAQARFPGATFVASQAIPVGLVNRVPGLESGQVGDPTGYPNNPRGVFVTNNPNGAMLAGVFPGSNPNQDYTVPGGGPINPATDLYAIFNTVNTGMGLTLRLPEPGGFSRYTRVSENNSPLPQDRVFFNYNFLDSVINRTNVNQFSFGVEKTFMDGIASVLVYIPFASTLNSLQYADGLGGTNTQFGNISVWLKALLYNENGLAVSAGLGVNTPTAEDVRLFATRADATPLVRVNNEAFHLNPFIGALYSASDSLFVQGFTQVDIDPNGNGVAVTDGNGGLTRVGRLYAPALFYTSVGAGYLIYQNPDNSGLLRRVVPMAELHYTTDLGSANTISRGAVNLTSAANRIDTLNLVTGTNVAFGSNANMNLGFGVPLAGPGRQYNWQVLAQLNVAFGRPR